MTAVWLRGRLCKAAFLAGAMFIAAGAQAAMAETVVRLASAQHSIGSLPVFIAQREGLFKAEGLKVEITDFRGGGPAVQALASGSVEACICAADHAIKLRARGQGGLVLTALGEYHVYGLVALSSTPVTDLKSLKGKKIGITSAGSLTDNTLRYFLEEAGMNPDRDVEITGIGTGAAMRAALASGAVAAGMLTTPDVQAALADDGKYKLVQDYRTLQYPALGIVVTEKWVKANEQAARSFASAIVKAEQMVHKDRAIVDAALAEMYPRLDEKLRKVLADEAPHLISQDGRMNPAGYKVMQKMLKVGDPNLPEVPYDQLVASSVLPKS